ncbi:MAG: hypothetical protein BMS9Abin05_0161 [Rhodothermia bacterium]|nr:MAG: hypothetical protein BMS9Abin05_0161 [Rhodothermia bacterium]
MSQLAREANYQASDVSSKRRAPMQKSHRGRAAHCGLFKHGLFIHSLSDFTNRAYLVPPGVGSGAAEQFDRERRCVPGPADEAVRGQPRFC